MAGYGDDTGFNSWLTENGYTLPVGSPSAVVLRQRGSQYIDGLYNGAQLADSGYIWTGYPTDGAAQERAWPRTNASMNGNAIDSTLIPVAVIKASYAAGYAEAVSPGILNPTIDPAKRVIKERVEGAIDVTYSDVKGDVADEGMPIIGIAYGLLKPFLISAHYTPVGFTSIGS